MARQNIRTYFSLLLYAASVLAIHYGFERHDNLQLILFYVVAFACYATIAQRIPDLMIVLAFGVFIRLALLGGYPTLSDDFYRFIWDGTLLNMGLSPFAELPSWYMSEAANGYGMSVELFDMLNSKAYFTIYPPISQAIFWLAVWLGGSIAGSVLIMRTIIIGFDVLNFFLLKNILHTTKKPTSLAYLYFLNPLVVIELTGNLHFEGLVLSAILLVIDLNRQQKYFKTGMGLSLGIAVKLTPLLLLPVFLFREKLKKQLKIYAGLALTLIICFLPILDYHLINGLQESISLFISKFEFNGSIYLILREVGYWYKGYNIIGSLGPALTIATAVLVFGISYLTRRWYTLGDVFILIYFVYLGFAMVVHPWYIVPMLGLSVLSNFRFPLVWSMVVFLTYLGYNRSGYTHPYIWISVEYAIIYGYFCWEMWRNLSQRNFEQPNVNTLEN